ncbi:hypothetical protein OS493_004208 [Desmophyllum pertusum]|uniref:Uncharacterized protein n=1 Tax=Desmophyllum pertusum TaxID=174260 RepID=A0A9W9ZWF4_9CNID|nr:hypothetical protein OS493_004208 [Desmophyllum pertusum]
MKHKRPSVQNVFPRRKSSALVSAEFWVLAFLADGKGITRAKKGGLVFLSRIPLQELRIARRAINLQLPRDYKMRRHESHSFESLAAEMIPVETSWEKELIPHWKKATIALAIYPYKVGQATGDTTKMRKEMSSIVHNLIPPGMRGELRNVNYRKSFY